MINLDMVGRLRGNRLMVDVSGKAVGALVDSAAAVVGVRTAATANDPVSRTV